MRRSKRNYQQIFCTYLSLAFLLFLACLPLKVSKLGAENKFPEIYKVYCLLQRRGCPCYASERKKKIKTRLFHAEAVHSLRKKEGSLLNIALKKKRCWYPIEKLEKMNYTKRLHSPYQNLDHSLLPLKKLSPAFIKNKRKKKLRLGLFWPTYYHLALEDFHPQGPQVPIHGKGKMILGRASKAFLEQVRWQGSGITKSGLRLHMISKSPKLRFEKYPNSMWGWGAGGGHQVFPYRTLALHFPGLCQALRMKGKCKKSRVIGSLLYIKEVKDLGISIPDSKSGSKKHDGYFCANDTGSPYYIRKDRIDIFVGTHGGGNPYLPVQRQGNALRKGGIENLVPADWRLWESPTKRIWCPENKIPRNPHRPRKGDCAHDYHRTAAHKALQIYAFLKADGEPLRCRL